MIIPKYFEDNHTFGVNDEPMRAYYIPTSNAQFADWTCRQETDRFLLLNGDWKFRYSMWCLCPQLYIQKARRNRNLPSEF